MTDEGKDKSGFARYAQPESHADGSAPVAEPDETFTDALARAHGEGQEQTIADVNAGLVDDLIAPRLSGLVAVWQPIETAPKDGSEFIAFGDVADYQPLGMMNVMQWVRDQEADKGGYFTSRCTIWPEGYSGVLMKPTLWMPLPAPPEDRGERC